MRDRLSEYIPGCAVVLLLLLAGCAGHERAVNVAGTAQDDKVQVDMKASNFAFDPDVIVITLGLKVDSFVLGRVLDGVKQKVRHHFIDRELIADDLAHRRIDVAGDFGQELV